MTYGRTINKALDKFSIDRETWPQLAADRGAWSETLLYVSAIPRSDALVRHTVVYSLFIMDETKEPAQLATDEAPVGAKRSHDESTSNTTPQAAPSTRRFILERGSEPMLGLLNDLGIGREEALGWLAEQASAKLVEVIPTMPPARIHRLLLSSFRYAHLPRLRPVVFAALEHTPVLPDDIVEELLNAQRGLLQSLPLRIRWRIWEVQSPPTLFLEATHPMVIKLQEEGTKLLTRVALHETAELAPRQRRAESQALQDLIALIGSPVLYNALSDLCAEIFGHDADRAIGLLRADMTMALHEAEDAARPVARWDPTHTYICCIDAALREQRLEPRAASILHGFLSAAGMPPLADADAACANVGVSMGSGSACVPSGFANHVASRAPGRVLADLALLLSPMPTVQLLVEATLARIEYCVATHALPISDANLHMLVALLSVAERARDLARSVPPVEKWQARMSKILHKALPLIAEVSIIVGAAARSPLRCVCYARALNAVHPLATCCSLLPTTRSPRRSAI